MNHEIVWIFLIRVGLSFLKIRIGLLLPPINLLKLIFFTYNSLFMTNLTSIKIILHHTPPQTFYFPLIYAPYLRKFSLTKQTLLSVCIYIYTVFYLLNLIFLVARAWFTGQKNWKKCIQFKIYDKYVRITNNTCNMFV